MEKSKKVLSMTQIVSIYILAIMVPIVRAFPIKLTETAGKASWVSAVIMVIPSIILVYMLNKLMGICKNKQDLNGSLTDVFNVVFGKTIGKVICILYVVWLIFLSSIELRLFAERFISTILTYAPFKFFLISMLIIVFFILRSKLSNYGRFAEIMLEIFGIVLIFIAVTSVSSLNIKELWPVTIYDTKKILLATLQGFSIFNVFTYSLFLGDRIKDIENLKKKGIIAAIATGVIGLLVLVITIGTFNDKIVTVLSQPFFTALKVMSIFGVLERIEAIFITLWATADFIIVSYYLLVASNICKQQFKLSKRRLVITPFVFIVYILAIIVARNYFSLAILTADISLKVNIFFGTIIPIITYITAKCRKLI